VRLAIEAIDGRQAVWKRDQALASSIDVLIGDKLLGGDFATVSLFHGVTLFERHGAPLNVPLRPSEDVVGLWPGTVFGRRDDACHGVAPSVHCRPSEPLNDSRRERAERKPLGSAIIDCSSPGSSRACCCRRRGNRPHRLDAQSVEKCWLVFRGNCFPGDLALYVLCSRQLKAVHDTFDMSWVAIDDQGVDGEQSAGNPTA
jgi:hypothetical protein